MAEFQPLRIVDIEAGRALRPITVYADGVYDLFHYGHIEQLRQAKQRFGNTILFVGVVTDEDVNIYKGGPVVMTHEERVRSVRMCPFVDEVIENPPFYPTLEFIDSMEIDLVAHDSIPYNVHENMTEIQDCYAPFKEADRFLETKRTPEISTTNLVHRIVSRVDEFVRRNEARGVHGLATVF